MYYYKGVWMNSDKDFVDAAYNLDKEFGQALYEYLPYVNFICDENDELTDENTKCLEQIEEYDSLIDNLENDLSDLDEIIDNDVEKIIDRMNEKIRECKKKINQIINEDNN